MTDPEWLASYPLDDKTKFDVFRDCSRCHTLRRPSMSTYNKDQLAWVMKRMVYSSGSSPMTFQLPGPQTATWGRAEWGEPSPQNHRQAEAIAAINLQRRHVGLRAENVAAAEGQGDAGDLHHVGAAGHQPGRTTRESASTARSGSTTSTTTRSADWIRRPAKPSSGGGPTERRKGRSNRPARAR